MSKDLALPENRALLPVEDAGRVSQVDVLRTIGLENLLELIASGMPYTKIAETVGVTMYVLSAFLHNLPLEQREIVKAALRASSEALMDQAWDILDNDDYALLEEGVFRPLTSAEVSLRQAKAQHLRQKAGIRNSRFRDKGPKDEEEGSPEAAQQKPTIHIHLGVAPRNRDLDRHLAIIEGESKTIEGTVQESGDD